MTTAQVSSSPSRFAFRDISVSSQCESALSSPAVGAGPRASPAPAQRSNSGFHSAYERGRQEVGKEGRKMAIRTPVKRTERHVNGAEIDSKVMLRVLAAVRSGDFSARMPTDWSGSAGNVAG